MGSLITVAEAAKSLAISPKQVRRLIDSGEIPVIPCGKGAKGDRIDPDDIETYKRRKKRTKGQETCLSTNVAVFGGSRSRSAASELDNLLAPKRARKTPANSKPA